MLRRLPAAPEFPAPLPKENPLLGAALNAAATLKRNTEIKAASRIEGNRDTFGGNRERSGVTSSSSGVFLGLRGPGDEETGGGGGGGAAAFLRRSSEGDSSLESDDSDDDDDEGNDHWLSQVEMVTYEGPHRRLWLVSYGTSTVNRGGLGHRESGPGVISFSRSQRSRSTTADGSN